MSFLQEYRNWFSLNKNTKEHAVGFAVGAIAACGAVTFTNPWEVVKTRLQLQGELSVSKTGPYRNAFSAFAVILKTEGIKGLQKGLAPAYIYQVLMNGTRLGLYEPLRNNIHQLLEGHERNVPPVYAMILSGALSGCVGALIASPIFLVKTRMQSYSVINPSVGHQHNYTNQGLISSLRAIRAADGIAGLWRGVDAAMMRTSIGSAVQLSTYDSSKRLLLTTGLFNVNYGKGDIKVHFAASLVTTMNPFDVASTRMYNQKVGIDGKGALYKTGMDCILKTIRTEGLKALFKGFSAHYLRIGPHTILTFVFLEQARAFARSQEWME